MELAKRAKRIPPYLFTTINEMKEKVAQERGDVIDLGMGNPDLPTPSHIVEALREAVMDPLSHRYPLPARGDKELREGIAEWYKKKFQVALDPEKEVLPLIGSKEGIAVVYLASLNPGDIALVPTPAYPVHFNGALLAGGDVYSLPINKENDFSPDFSSIPGEVLKKARIVLISYPNNPTAAIASKEFFAETVVFARKYGLILIHDFAYSEITFNGYRPPSLLQTKGAKELGIEFHSLSKTYNMPGWRIGFVVGNGDIIDSICRVKSYIDFGIFTPIQKAACLALTNSQDCVKEIRQVYQKRRDVLVRGLTELGWEVELPMATMYVWAPIPPSYSGMSSLGFSKFLLQKTGVVVSPGIGFGEGGEGFVRFALVADEEKIRKAVRQIGSIFK